MKYVISYDEVYDLEFEKQKERIYLVRFASSNGLINPPKRIHAKNFEEAYQFARSSLKQYNFDRIVSIEEELNP